MSQESIQRAAGLLGSGNVAKAEALCREVLASGTASKVASAGAHQLLGRIMALRGDLAAAVRSFREALALQPVEAALHFDLATALLEAGHAADAAEAYAEASRLRPGWLAPLANRGIALQRIGRLVEAEAALQAALALQPGSEPVLTALAGVLHSLGRHREAVDAGRQAVAVAPGQAEPWINLGLALHATGRLDEAADACLRALAISPDDAMAVYNLGHVRNDQWRSAEALAGFRRAVELAPGYQPARHALLFNLLYDPRQNEETLFLTHSDWARDFCAALPESRPPPVDPKLDSRRLRVGYVSPDFRAHSCAYFLKPLFTAHDRTRLEVYAYANVDKPDATTAWFRNHTEHWRDTRGRSDGDIARQIRADGIDILVDLAGHTRDQPLGVFALQPAPVQVAWLGYPATAGLRQIGYRLTDAEADPPGAADRLHAERLVRLPGGLHCYEAPADAPEVNALPALRNGGVTFGSFNNISKVTPEVVGAWAGILRLVAGSRLVLKGRLLAHAAARNALAQAFASEGIDPARIDLRDWVPRAAGPLSAYQDIDIALDTFPYNGTTTTFEALWMGVPVVTLRGQRHAARVGASILCHLGRPEWVAADVPAYTAIALGLASDLPGLVGLRQALRGELGRSSLTDAAGFARKLEAVYRELVTRVATAAASLPAAT